MNPLAQAEVIDPMTGLPSQQMTNVPPAASSLINPFSPEAQQNAQGMYGGMRQRQQSVGAPCLFKDQTGDGKITQADVIKARTKGYKK